MDELVNGQIDGQIHLHLQDKAESKGRLLTKLPLLGAQGVTLRRETFLEYLVQFLLICT